MATQQNQVAGSNAPIEIRKKEEVPGVQDQPINVEQPETKKDEMANNVNNQRDFLKQVAQKIFHQIKNGCQKDLCLNMYCKTNLFGKLSGI